MSHLWAATIRSASFALRTATAIGLKVSDEFTVPLCRGDCGYIRPATRSLSGRGLRMMDALTPWRARGGSFSGGRTPSTLFVRAYLPESLWKLHVTRIVSEARRIKPGGVLHFWLHPHNLGVDVPRGIRRLEQVLDVIKQRAPRGTVYA